MPHDYSTEISLNRTRTNPISLEDDTAFYLLEGGEIVTPDDYAISIDSGSSIGNYISIAGAISANRGVSVEYASYDYQFELVVEETGTIDADYIALDIREKGQIVNYGGISGDYDAIWIDSVRGLEFENHGDVSGSLDAYGSTVDVQNTGLWDGSFWATDSDITLSNSGQITGGFGHDSLSEYRGGTFDITNSGEIAGGVFGSRYWLSEDRLINSGDIGGDVYMYWGRDLYQAEGDGSVSGTVYGGSGKDTLIGAQANDTLNGGNFDDILFGRLGADVLNGDAGDDVVNGGRGRDIIVGGRGDDRLTGGDDADMFLFDTQFGSDHITDFRLGEDRLRLDDGLWRGDQTAEQVVETFGTVNNGRAVLDFGGGNMVVFSGIDDVTMLVDDIVIV